LDLSSLALSNAPELSCGALVKGVENLFEIEVEATTLVDSVPYDNAGHELYWKRSLPVCRGAPQTT
jgi:hypothetical protein